MGHLSRWDLCLEEESASRMDGRGARRGRRDNEGVISITQIGGHGGLSCSGETRVGKEGVFGKER